MAIDDASWRVLGQSVQLPPSSQLLIAGGTLNQILDNLSDHPNIQPWIGNRDQWKDILNSIVGETLGGQKRRLGRFFSPPNRAPSKTRSSSLPGNLPRAKRAASRFISAVGWRVARAAEV